MPHVTASRRFANNGGLSYDRYLTIPIDLAGVSGEIECVTLVDSNGIALDAPGGDGIRVYVTNPSAGPGGAGDVNVTDRVGRILGRVGVDLLTDAIGLLTNTELRAAPVPVSVSSLPLPSGAATETTLSSVLSALASVATDAGLASVYGVLGSILTRLGDGSTHVAVDSLPSGLATVAKQDTGNASVASIDGKTPALVTGRVPVDGSAVTQPISAAALPLPAGAAQEHTAAASPGACRISDGAAFIDPRSIRALTSGDQVTIANASLPVTGAFWQATQPVSATTLPLPTGASTEATLAAIKAKTDNLDVSLSTRAVTGLTDAQLRAAAVPVSGTFFQATQPVSGTFWQATQPISAAALPLPAGAATAAGLMTLDADLAAIFTRLSDGTQHVAVDSLPGGLATGARQDTGNASCASIDGKVTACNTGAVTVAASALPAGAATQATLLDVATATIASAADLDTLVATAATESTQQTIADSLAIIAKESVRTRRLVEALVMRLDDKERDRL